MKALLIIDMQKTSFNPETPRYDSDRVIERINKLSRQFRQNGDKVIFIQHDGSKQNFCKPDTEEWEILSSIEINTTDIFISKTANDSFYNSTLEDNLIKLDVDNVVITGCATDFCVDSTVKSALTKDFNVIVISNGHTTADRPIMTAKQIIEHYNWIWKKMTPTKSRIELVDSDEYLKRIKNDFSCKANKNNKSK